MSEAQPLSFPPSHFAKLAPSDFLHASLTSSSKTSDPSSGIRPNGRAPTQFCPAALNSGSLTNTNGSAVISLGSTTVVCGIRAELLPVSHIHGGLPSDLEAWRLSTIGADGVPSRPVAAGSGTIRSDAEIMADLRLLVPNLELSTGCNPAHLPGNAPSSRAQALTLRILALLRTSNLVELAPLLVWHRPALGENVEYDAGPNDPERDTMAEDGPDESQDVPAAEWQIKAIWTLYIDLWFISLDGVAFDAALLSIVAALMDTRLPRAYWDEDRESILCSPLRSDSIALGLRQMPCSLTAGIFTHGGEKSSTILFDMDDFEESICEDTITVVVTASSNGRGKGLQVLRVEATGKSIDTATIAKVAEAAREKRKVWQKLLGWK